MKELKELLLFQRTHALHWDVTPSSYDVGFDTPYWVSLRPTGKTPDEFDRRMAGYWVKGFEINKKGKTMNDNVSNQMADAQVELADKPVTTDEQKANETKVTFQTPEVTGTEVKENEDTTRVVI